MSALNNNKKTILEFATPCFTPNYDQGYCVEINRCEVLLNAIKNGNNSTFEFVRRSRCGPINEDQQHPRVCCGKYGGNQSVLLLVQ